MKSYGYYWRMATIICSSIYPLLCLIFCGYKTSLSQYWNTELQPLYLTCNIATSYYFLQLKDWSISGLLLLLVTVFSVDMHGSIHNVFAVMFFLSVILPYSKTKRYRPLIYLYVLGGILCAHSLLLGEIICILSISAYHSLILIKFKTIKEFNERDNSK